MLHSIKVTDVGRTTLKNGFARDNAGDGIELPADALMIRWVCWGAR